jgi:phage FluMu protein Com
MTAEKDKTIRCQKCGSVWLLQDETDPPSAILLGCPICEKEERR